MNNMLDIVDELNPFTIDSALDEPEEIPITPTSSPVVKDEPEPPPKDDLEHTCDLCEWRPSNKCKDKHRALRNHMKKFHPEHYKQNYPTRQKTKVNVIQKMNDVVEDVKDLTINRNMTDDEQRQVLIEDIEVLKMKFRSLDYNWTTNNDSSLEMLKREKSLFLRMIQDKVAEQSLFRLLVVAGKGAEKITDTFKIADIDGYSKDIMDAEEEIVPILRELVDTGVISSTALTPEMRLAMVLVGLGVARESKNKVKKNEVDAEQS